jgi:hypothetical protein
MPALLTRFVFTAVLACAAIPAWCAGMPDFGSKNFSPGGDTPSYFSNENGAVGVAASETMDDGSDDASIRSIETISEPRQIARTTPGRHERFAVGRRSGYGGAAHARSARRAGSANAEAMTRHRLPRTGSAKPVRHASARPSWRKG